MDSPVSDCSERTDSEESIFEIRSNIRRHRIISIEGNIGSGKSTLLANLKKELEGRDNIVFLREPVDDWEAIRDKDGKTMLMKFYADQEKYSFAFQMMAYISRLSLIKETIRENPSAIIISERSLYVSVWCNRAVFQIFKLCSLSSPPPHCIWVLSSSLPCPLQTDKMVFAKMLHESGMIEDVNYQIYLRWFEHFAEDCALHRVVYVRTDPEICHDRIAKRSRSGEEGIPLSYLQECHKYHEAMLDKSCDDCVCQDQLFLDGNKDIYSSSENLQHMIHVVTDYIRSM